MQMRLIYFRTVIRRMEYLESTKNKLALSSDRNSKYERLIIALTNDDRPQDIVHMAVDAKLREKLYIKYDIR